MIDVNLEVIGCGDAFGSGGNLHTCFYVSSASVNLLIDCGASTGPALNRRHHDIASLDYIVLSHLHGDHYGGLPFMLLDSLQTRRLKPLHIIGPVGTKERTTKLFDLLYPGSIRNLDATKFIYTEYTAQQEVITADFTLQAFPVIHTEEAMPHGLRLTLHSKVISYSGDTSWSDQLIPLADEADLFICECTFFNTHAKGHLNYQTIMQHRDELRCKNLLLTHFDQEMLDAADQVLITCAHEGMLITI